jgi:hypothetical protein
VGLQLLGQPTSLILQHFLGPSGKKGNFYCTADMGTATVMEEFGATSKRLPEWLITPNTMQTCKFSPENKQKLRPGCMIVEITHDEIDRALNKRTRNGDTIVPAQINGRPRKIWLMELGYPTDTRYMDKVMEKKEKDAKICKLLTTEGLYAMLLPSSIVLGSAGTYSNCFYRATKEMDIPNARKKRNYTASSTYTVYTVYKTLCPNGDTWKDKASCRSKGKNKQIASLPTQPVHYYRGRPVNRHTPSRPPAFIFLFIYKEQQCILLLFTTSNDRTHYANLLNDERAMYPPRDSSTYPFTPKHTNVCLHLTYLLTYI